MAQAQGQNVGYVRVSAVDQHPDRQLVDIQLDEKFTDFCSGATIDRPKLKECLQYCRRGDILHIHSLDRLGRNVSDLLNIVKDFTNKGVTVKFHKENLDFTPDVDANPISKLIFTILAAVSEYERSLIRERQREGLARARQNGKHCGRSRGWTIDQLEKAKKLRASGVTMKAIAKTFGVSERTVYRMLAEETEKNPILPFRYE